MLPTDRFVFGFFVLLFLALFFGDGKQAVVEVYGAAVVLMIWFFRLSQISAPIGKLPRLIANSWIFVFIAATLSTLTSDSVGFSISWGIRLLSGFLVYQVFYDLSSARIETAVSRSMIAFAAASTATSLIFGLFPWFQSVLPSMNLISRSYGHSHLADLLVFVFPLVWGTVVSQPFFRGAAVMLLYSGALLFTLARAAWIVVFGGVFVSAFYLRKIQIKALLVLTLCFGIVLCAVFFGKSYLIKKGAPLQSYTRPESVAFRVEYWNQALKGFMERPITGNGPGTFSLVSTRFQKHPFSASWFAHSQPLQLLAEQGVVGFLAFGGLLLSHVLIWYKERSKFKKGATTEALILGCALVVGYGLFEYVLDYFVIWIMLFAVAGLITGRIAEKKAEPGAIGVKIALIVIGVYYILWVSSNGVALLSKKYDSAFLLAPFDAPQTLLYLDKNTGSLGHTTRSLALFFHKRNPQILDALSKDAQKTGDHDKSLALAKLALYADPQNLELLSRYFSLHSLSGSTYTGEEMLEFLKHALPDRYGSYAESFSPYVKEINDATHDIFTTPEPLHEGVVSLLYLIGLKQLHDRPHITLLFWNLAKDISPDYAAMYIELAMYYQHIEHNDKKAQEVLRECATRESPRDQCRAFFDTELLPPGDFYEAMR